MICQALETYLPTSQNWIHRLIQHIDEHQLVLSKRLLPNAKQIYPLSESHFIIPKLHGLPFFAHLQWRRALQRFQPALIHAHFGPMGWEMLPLAKRFQIPLVVSFYGYDYVRLPNNEPIWLQRYRDLFAYASAFLVEGPHGASLLESLGCPKDRIRIVSLPAPDVNPMPVSQNAVFTILQVANYRPKKGFETHIMSLSALKEAGVSFHAHFIGEGLEVLKPLIEGAHLNDAITLHPPMNAEDMKRWIDKSSVLVQPSHWSRDGDCEGGAPVILLDAQARGLPVVATNHADIPFVVQENVSGFLVPELDAQALTNALIRLSKLSPSDRETMGRAGIQFMQNRFNGKMLGNQLSAIYAELARPWPNSL